MLCTRNVCEVSLCSHSVPSGGFNSLADTHAKNMSPSWIGPISGILSNTNGRIMVLSLEFFNNSLALIMLDSNSPLIIVTTLSCVTSFLSDNGIRTLIVGLFISPPLTVWNVPVDNVFLVPAPMLILFFPSECSMLPSTQEKDCI